MCRDFVRFGRTRVCIKPVSLQRVEEWVLSRLNRSKQSYHGAYHSGTCLGGGIEKTRRAGRSYAIFFQFAKTRVCIKPVSLHRVEECVPPGLNRSKQSYHGAYKSGTCLGGGIGSKIRARKKMLNYFRFRETRVYIRQSNCTKCKKIMGFLAGKPQQTVL